MLSLCSPTTPTSSFPTYQSPGLKLTFTKLPKFSHCQNSEHLSPGFSLISPHIWLWFLGTAGLPLKVHFVSKFYLCFEYLGDMITSTFLLRFITCLGCRWGSGETNSLHGQGQPWIHSPPAFSSQVLVRGTTPLFLDNSVPQHTDTLYFFGVFLSGV